MNDMKGNVYQGGLMNEKGKEVTTLFYKERGGLSVGVGYSTWPFAKLEIFDDKLILTTFIFFGKIELRKSEVISVEKSEGLLGSGVKINHNNSEVDPFIVFQSLAIDVLLSKLENAGYPVKRPEKSS